MSEKFTCDAVGRSALGPPAKRAGSELLWRCPNHEDEHPSLSVNPPKDVWMCGPCGASGNAWQLAAFLAKVSPDDKAAVTAWLREHGLLNGSRAVQASSKEKPIATYDYKDESGKVLFQVVRYEPKDFKQRRPDGNGGWVWSLTGARRVLYNLPEVLKAKSILCAEGEKDCESAKGLGLVATTSGAVGSWRAEFAEVLRGKRVAIVADADEPGRKHAARVAASLFGKVESLKVLEMPNAKDLSEWVEKGGARQVLLGLIQTAPGWKPVLAKGCSVLERLVSFIRRFVSMTECQARVAVLWVAHTHAIEAADTTPYLAVNSVEKQSGKTRLLEVFEMLVANPWLTGRVTAAVLTRKIDKEHPTLLLDESDAAFAGEKEYAEALRGILNTGHRRGGKASCCVGQGTSISFRDFSTFSPKAIAGIGKLPDTVADRATPIRLRRAAPGEKVERFRRREVERETSMLRNEVQAWCAERIEAFRNARPQLPPELTDRQQDGAEPLLAIADAAGGAWPEVARRALIELCGEAQAADDSIGVRLLGDIRAIFTARKTDRLPSAELAAALAVVETSSWGEWSRGKPLTQSRLASLLKPYEIQPRTIRVGDDTPRGYRRDQFFDAFKRYLSHPEQPPEEPIEDVSPPPPTAQNATPPQPNVYAGPGDFPKRNTENDVAFQRADKSSRMSHVADVAVSTPGTGAGADDDVVVGLS